MIRGRRALPALPLILLVLATLPGCSARHLPALSVDPLHQLPHVERRDGLVLGVEPLLDDDVNRKRHGVAFVDRRLLAVRVAARNEGEASWLLQRSAVSLRITDTAEAAEDAAGVGSEIGGALQVTSLAMSAGSLAILGSLAAVGLAVAAVPLVHVGQKLDADASAVEQHVLVSELHPTTVSPGESAVGLVFFPIEGPPEPGDTWTIGVEALRLPQGRTESFSFAIRQLPPTPPSPARRQ